jgi:predicted dehydrogenase
VSRKLRMGMVGGGKESFIGEVHRMATRLDNQAELVCGSFSATRKKSLDSGADLGLPAERVYGTYRDMFKIEAKLPPEERMDFVCVVTPNNMHYPISMAALDAGFHVVCDKPMTVTLDEAQNLARKIKACNRLFCLTHNYVGSPMVKEARALVAAGELGAVRRVAVEYAQGWLATREETAGCKQAAWRTNPKRAGWSCCMGDIGTHAAHLAEYIVGDALSEVCSDLSTFVRGRQLDDDGSVLLRFANGARGVLWASQVAVGEENNLRIRVYGEKGSVEWAQQEGNSLIVRRLDRPMEIRRVGTPFVGSAAAAATRMPAGHPEGYLEAFANVYKEFFRALRDFEDGKKIAASDYDYPGVEDGIRVAAFIEAVVRSSRSTKDKWFTVEN